MKTFSILFLCAGLLLQTGHAQQHQYEYQKAYDYAKLLQDTGDYYKAIIAYNKANLMEKPDTNDISQRIAFCANKLNQLIIDADFAKNKAEKAETIAKKQKKEIDSLYKETKSSLARLEKMQQKAETAMLEKAIKDQSPGWKGFAKYTSIDYNSDSIGIILNEVDSLDLSYNGLLRIPKEVVKCPNLKYINLLGNPDIDWKNSVNTLKQLKNNVEIYISVNDIYVIDSRYWHLITGIEILRHDLKYIPESILQQKQLKCLIIDYNELETLPPEIASLTNLVRLSLYENKIKILPAEIGKLINLAQLDLRKNQLTALPPQIGSLKKLTELNLDNNPLIILPDEVGALTNLTTLSLFNDSLNNLPDGIWKLKKLTYLDLSENYLTDLPDGIGNLTNLTTLSLYNNSLTTLPDEIWNLNKLSFLVLGENKLTVPLDGIGNLTNLTTLGLRSIGLDNLPAEIGKLTKLSALRLEGNDITKKINELGKMTNLTALSIDMGFLKVNSENIAKLKKLTSLYLFGDEFSTLPKEINKLTNLNTLYLIGDSLITIPAEISGLTNLTKLGLNITSMSQLPAEIGALTQLKHLDLVKTEIKSIPIELFNLKITANDFVEIGNKLFKAEKYDQALQCYFKSIEIDSAFAPAYGNAGLCYRMQGEMEKALSYLNKHLSFNENSIWCLNQLIFTYDTLKLYEESYTMTKKLILIDSTNYENWSNLSYYCLFVNKYPEGIRAAEKSLDLARDKNKKIAITNLALNYVLNNQYNDEAKPLYLEWKDKEFPEGGSARDFFLMDIKDLEDANITHPDFEKVRELLNE